MFGTASWYTAGQRQLGLDKRLNYQTDNTRPKARSADIRACLCLLWLSAPAAPASPMACELKVSGLHIEVAGVASDGVWGPTIEISVSAQGQPLTRLIAEEARPIESCWWTDLDHNRREDLNISITAARDSPSGAAVYEWNEGHLTARVIPEVPALPNATWRYLVGDHRLWAYRVTDGPAAELVRYRLQLSQWVPDSITDVQFEGKSQ